MFMNAPLNAHAAVIDAFINETTRCFGAPPASITTRQQQEADVAKEYDDTDKGALFKNTDKDPNDDRDRDYAGTLNVGGTEFWLSAWIRVSKKGTKYLSLSVKPKDVKPTASKKPRAEDFDDEIRF